MINKRTIIFFIIIIYSNAFSQQKVLKELNEKTFSWVSNTKSHINAKDTLQIDLHFTNNKIEFIPKLSSFKSESLEKVSWTEQRPEYYSFKIKNNILFFIDQDHKTARSFKIIKEKNQIVKIIDSKSSKQYLLNQNFQKSSPPRISD
ncbi:hypothetical protein [Chryseobacterium taiwanense]|uniref:Uncharacterized protein n=1 Tax=Chryseobacterium taiwanense TaxID=363331 RepID=A0A0B4DIN1_9FLAO|nr:hypothetical protein [Chryseobacterium taiwanense]KIC64240.1 hypothetical protein RM51_05880 [Chryseobacterium taiwanense]